jgi:hypothetical protein
MTPVLQLEGVVKKYRRGDEHVLVDFDFDLDAGGFVFVTGRSGPANRHFCISPAAWMRRGTGTVPVAGQGRVSDDRPRAEELAQRIGRHPGWATSSWYPRRWRAPITPVTISLTSGALRWGKQQAVDFAAQYHRANPGEIEVGHYSTRHTERE